MSELERLTEVFRKLGAEDPEGWASSQVSEGINQLGRYAFLRQAWSKVIDDANTTWMTREIREAELRPNDPFAGVGIALSKLKEAGVNDQLINDVVRGKQAELLFSFCSLLDDPGEVPEEIKRISWCLFQTDEEGLPIAAIEALHESVLETDPTGREMRPRTTS